MPESERIAGLSGDGCNRAGETGRFLSVTGPYCLSPDLYKTLTGTCRRLTGR